MQTLAVTQPTAPQVVSGERVYASVLFQPTSGADPLELLVTDKAVTFGKDAFVGVRRTVRVEHGDIHSVALERMSITKAIVGGVFLFLAGAAGLLGVIANGDAIEGGIQAKHVAVPLALVVVGLAMPFIARGQRRLELSYPGGRFSWKPPMMVFKGSRDEADRAMVACAEALSRAGHRVSQ